MRKFLILFSFPLLFLLSCSAPRVKKLTPLVAFLDAFQDETIDQARIGFFAALAHEGYDPAHETLNILYKNAQGSPQALNLALSYLVHQPVSLLATNTTLPTIAAVRKTKTIPIFMMVSSSPTMAGLNDEKGMPPVNLFGVYENLDYIATSAGIVHELLPAVKTMGVIFSQGETQSLNAVEKLKAVCLVAHIKLEVLPVNSSAETQLVVQALIHRHIDAFFALPDNSVFASFETILQTCSHAGIPIFTSEEGLVKRGALAAFGADIFQWGYQSGLQAAAYLKNGNLKGLEPALVRVRRKVYNDAVASLFHVKIPAGFKAVSSVVKPEPVKVVLGSGTGFYGDALVLGLGLAILALGIYLSLKIFNIPDITTDGSYTLGAAITGLMLLHGWPVWLALALSFIGGAIAGSITAMITTKLRVNALLSGILVMTALYSVNITLMGRSNITIDSQKNFFQTLAFIPDAYRALFTALLFAGGFWLLVTWLLRTDFGLAMRATGNSESMVRSLGVNTDRMKITGLALSNGLTAVSGFLIAQFQGFSDINMGIGIVITGLGSVIIGETLMDLLKVHSIAVRVAGVILGSLIFQLLLAATLAAGVDPNLLKGCTALLVLVVVSIPGLRFRFKN